jgi:hypothetical protein
MHIEEQPEHEPVAWASWRELARIKDFDSTIYANGDFDGAVPLYTAPPRREWRGLTMQEINALPEIGGVMWRMGTSHAVVRAIRAVEQALKEKNT